MAKRIAVIGAGAAGLASARWLLDAGFETVVFERTAAVGGLWRGDTGIAYPSLQTNTSKQKTAFSDLAFAAELPDFPIRDDVVAYLERYADVTGVRAIIRFGHDVQAVRPAPAATGGWTVDGEPFDAVVVAIGLFARPAEPAIPGRELFRGTVVHSRTYRDPAVFAGHDVVVVGAGSSGADIAVELATVARSVSISVRDMPMFSPRHYRGRPYDHRATRLVQRLPVWARARITRRVLAAEYRRRGHRLERLSPKRTPGMDLLEELDRGRIALRPALAALDATGAIFSDGSRIAADMIVLATGYRAEFPFLPEGLPPRIGGALALYRLVFPPGIGNVAFAGLTRVSGPVFPVSELQARWIAAVFAGRAALPSEDVMRAEIEARLAQARAANDDQMRVELLPYLDDIAGRIGARPSLWRDPRLLTAPVSARDYLKKRAVVPKLREP